MSDRQRINYDWTVLIAEDTITSYADRTSTTTSTLRFARSSKYCRVMRQNVKKLLERHKIVFNSMVRNLDICEKNVFVTFVQVADVVFEDGVTNWGRILTIYAFATRLAMACNSSESKLLDTIATDTGKYIWQKHGTWILQHGGWDAFVEAFDDTDTVEKGIWRGLLFTAIGLGAMATVLAVR